MQGKCQKGFMEKKAIKRYSNNAIKQKKALNSRLTLNLKTL